MEVVLDLWWVSERNVAFGPIPVWESCVSRRVFRIKRDKLWEIKTLVGDV